MKKEDIEYIKLEVDELEEHYIGLYELAIEADTKFNKVPKGEKFKKRREKIRLASLEMDDIVDCLGEVLDSLKEILRLYSSQKKPK